MNYGVDGPQQYHAIVNLRNWPDYKDYKGVLITRTAYADRDRMTHPGSLRALPIQ